MKLVHQNSTGSYREYIDNDARYLKSYAVFVVRKDRNGVVLDERYWDYSTTTSKHIGQFLGTSMREVRKMIKDGIVSLQNLN